MARLVKPNGEKITQLCNEKGWGAQELSAKADIALKTAAKVMRGEPVFRKTVKDVADALGTSCGDLLEAAPPEDAGRKRYSIKLIFVGAKKAEFDEDRIIAIIEKLNEAINGSGDIDMEGLEGNSVVLTLSLTVPDMVRLIKRQMETGGNWVTQIGANSIHLPSGVAFADIADILAAQENVMRKKEGFHQRQNPSKKNRSKKHR